MISAKYEIEVFPSAVPGVSTLSARFFILECLCRGSSPFRTGIRSYGFEISFKNGDLPDGSKRDRMLLALAQKNAEELADLYRKDMVEKYGIEGGLQSDRFSQDIIDFVVARLRNYFGI